MIISQMMQAHFELTKNSSLFQEFYEGIERFEDAPILKKMDLSTILNTKFRLNEQKTGVYLVRSGGTTQNPLFFPVDIQENFAQREILAQKLSEHKIFTPDSIAFNLFDYGDMYRSASIFDDIIERCNATTLPICTNVEVERVCELLHLFKPTILLAMPSNLIMIAKHLESKKKVIKIPNILFGGEFLLPSCVPLFQKVYKTQEIYAAYGGAEVGIWAWSHYSKNPSLYSIIDNIHIEIINKNENGFGNIIVTNFFRKRFPLFRYDVGDIGRLVEKEGKPYLELVSRDKSSFQLDGVTYYLDDFKEITEGAETYQIQIQPHPDKLASLKFLIVNSTLKGGEETFILKTTLLFEKVFEKRSIDWVHLDILVCDIDKLYKNKNTSKIPRLIDFRV